ncbi:anti-sigma factor domain-containing protein [Actinomycetospora atypica]|uniref:Regulator of SigK n=1 Tax=Actinomycetospora atypica TaxID=1290095 RepID=A0ABV9YVW9_9PSEU
MKASPDGHPELAVAWVLHSLEPDEDAEFGDHLGDCPACLQIVAETEEVTALMGTAPAPAEPPASLRSRILEAAGSEGVSSEGARSDRVSDGTSQTSDVSQAPRSDDGVVVPMRRRWVRRATAGIAVAAAAALVVVIGGLVNANRDLADERDAAAARAEQSGRVVQVLDAASRSGTPHAVLATPDGGFVGLVVERGTGPELLAAGLAPNDADHTYVLWGLEGETPVGLGTFDMSGSGPVTTSVPSTSAGTRFAGFAVSYEPGRTVPATPTQVVASGQLTG